MWRAKLNNIFFKIKNRIIVKLENYKRNFNKRSERNCWKNLKIVKSATFGEIVKKKFEKKSSWIKIKTYAYEKSKR